MSETQQDFGWLDEELAILDKNIVNGIGISVARDELFDTDPILANFKAAIQAHFTAQQKEAYDKGFSTGSIEQSKFDKYVPKQHQVDLLRARIDEVEYPASVRAYKAGLGAGEYESFLTKDEQSRRNRIQAELDKLEGEG